MHTGDVREVTDRAGGTYYARLAPLERPRGGVSMDLKTLVFETAEGSWAGSTPVYGHAQLWSMSDDDLQRLARRAVTLA